MLVAPQSCFHAAVLVALMQSCFHRQTKRFGFHAAVLVALLQSCFHQLTKQSGFHAAVLVALLQSGSPAATAAREALSRGLRVRSASERCFSAPEHGVLVQRGQWLLASAARFRIDCRSIGTENICARYQILQATVEQTKPHGAKPKPAVAPEF